MFKRFVFSVLLSLTMSFSVGVDVICAGSVDDFVFDTMEVEYHLSKDENNISVVRVKEKLTAVFPEYDQNRGIVRKIPTTYQDKSLNLQVVRVMRDGGIANIYQDKEEGGYRVLTIRDNSDVYLYGKHVYEIEYNLRNVILKPSDADLLEFYWNVNGTGWAQSFNQVTARVYLSSSIAQQQLANNLSCYTGQHGQSLNNCEIQRSGDIVIVKTTKKLLANEGLTFAIGFQPNTFSIAKTHWSILLVASWILLLVCVAVIVLLYGLKDLYGILRNQPRTQSYPVEYLPPKNINIFSALHLYHRVYVYGGRNNILITSGLLDLAVRNKIKIIEQEKKEILGKTYKYSIEIAKGTEFSDIEQNFLQILGVPLRFNEVLPIFPTTQNTSNIVYKLKGLSQLAANENSTLYLIKKHIFNFSLISVLMGLCLLVILQMLATSVVGGVWMGGYVNIILGALLLIILSIYKLLGDLKKHLLLNSKYLLLICLGWVPIFIVLLITNITPWSLSTLFYLLVFVAFLFVFYVQFSNAISRLASVSDYTAAGEDLRLYLFGLERYIKMAEKERLQFAQSVVGADREFLQEGVNKIKLYERLLPYAIIFGCEKSWSKALQGMYQEYQVSPGWYRGGAFNSVLFMSNMNGFVTSNMNTASVNNSKSGSSGGGFSGGGGGGGGGGGC